MVYICLLGIVFVMSIVIAIKDDGSAGIGFFFVGAISIAVLSLIIFVVAVTFTPMEDTTVSKELETMPSGELLELSYAKNSISDYSVYRFMVDGRVCAFDTRYIQVEYDTEAGEDYLEYTVSQPPEIMQLLFFLNPTEKEYVLHLS